MEARGADQAPPTPTVDAAMHWPDPAFSAEALSGSGQRLQEFQPLPGPGLRARPAGDRVPRPGPSASIQQPGRTLFASQLPHHKPVSLFAGPAVVTASLQVASRAARFKHGKLPDPVPHAGNAVLYWDSGSMGLQSEQLALCSGSVTK